METQTRSLVRKRAGERCEYCLLPQEFYDLTFHIEHVIATQHLADDSPDNLALACNRCNLHKGTNLSSIDPQTGEPATLFNPRTENWSDHFMMMDAEINGITPSGRATARLLNMNSERRVLLRKQLISEGRF